MKTQGKTAKDVISEFYHMSYDDVVTLANAGKLGQGPELDWGEDVGNEILE